MKENESMAKFKKYWAMIGIAGIIGIFTGIFYIQSADGVVVVSLCFVFLAMIVLWASGE